MQSSTRAPMAGALVLLASALMCTACIPDSYRVQLEAEIEAGQQTIAALDRGIAALDRQPGLWETALGGTVNELGDVAQDLALDVRQEVQTLIIDAVRRTEQLGQALIGAAGAEFRCNADFVGLRVRQALEQIRFDTTERVNDALSKLQLPSIETSRPRIVPAVCSVAPTNVIMGEDRLVRFFGYDFDQFAGAGEFDVTVRDNDDLVMRDDIGSVVITDNFLLQVTISNDPRDIDFTRHPRLVLQWNQSPVESQGQGIMGRSEVPIQISADAPGTQPDLEITNIELRAAPVVGQAEAEVWVTVANSGSAMSPETILEWRADASSDWQQLRLGPLQPPFSTTLPFYSLYPRSCKCMSTARVDATNQITEIDETNNRKNLEVSTILPARVRTSALPAPTVAPPGRVRYGPTPCNPVVDDLCRNLP